MLEEAIHSLLKLDLFYQGVLDLVTMGHSLLRDTLLCSPAWKCNDRLPG